jgi:hypothetical protein
MYEADAEDVELSDEFLQLLHRTAQVFVEANAERGVTHLDNIMINATMLVVLHGLKQKNPDRRRAEAYLAGLLAHWDEINIDDPK